MTKAIYSLSAFFAACLLALLIYSCGNTSGTGDASISPATEASANLDLEERATRDSTVKSLPKTTITFETTTHDFGKVTEGEIVKYAFVFTNTGDAPFLISNVLVSCGCTEPRYSKKPIMPGEKSAIDIQFNTNGKVGHNTNRPVTIIGNLEQEAVVYFNAEVVKK